METPIYWRTKYGSIVERQTGPDRNGWMTVQRLKDGAVREWNVRDMTPLSTEEVVALAAHEVQS